MAIEIVSFPIKNDGSFHRFLLTFTKRMPCLDTPETTEAARLIDPEREGLGVCGPHGLRWKIADFNGRFVGKSLKSMDLSDLLQI